MDSTEITAQEVLNAVLQNTEAQRETIQQAVLNGALSSAERITLRQRLLSITEQQYPPTLEQSGEENIGWTRTWLFSLLAIVADDDQAAHERLLRHLRPEVEPNEWVSYWLLYGLILVNSPLLSQAIDIARPHPKILVSMMSWALEALREPTALQARKEIEKALTSDNWEQQWAAMRALRWVILQDHYPSILQALCHIVDHASERVDDFNRNAYDAIIALGNIKPRTESARQAAEALDRFVSRARRHSQRVPERRKAIFALGKLRVEKVDLLLDELIIDDPTMAREAALALEKMLGADRAAERIFEKVLGSPLKLRTVYADALRWMEVQAQVISTLDNLSLSGREEQKNVARDLMNRVGGALAFERLRVQRNAMDNFTELMKETQKEVDRQFSLTIEASRIGFRNQSWMDLAVFVVGLAFVIVSGINALTNASFASWVGTALAGGMGILGILYNTLIAQPREKIKDAVLDQSQLQMIFLGYIRDLNRVDQAYIEQILEDKPLSAEEVQKFVDITIKLRTTGVEDINKLRTNPSSQPS